MYLSVLERDIRRRADRLNRCCPPPPHSCLLIQGLIPCGIRSEILACKKPLKAVPGHTVVGIHLWKFKPAPQFPPTALGQIVKQIGTKLI